MDPPCIKGLTLQGVVEDVQLLRDAGRLSPEEIRSRLGTEEFAWLREGIHGGLWYPIQGYTCLAEILLEIEGRGDPEYLVRRGAAAAERLYATGLYPQLRHAEERRSQERAGGPGFGEEDGRYLTTLSGEIFNFGIWSYREQDDDVVIEVTHAAPLPELARLSAHGFIAHVVSRVRDTKVEVQSERPAADVVAFRFRLGGARAPDAPGRSG